MKTILKSMILFFLALLMTKSFGQQTTISLDNRGNQKPKIEYKYREYEEFELDDLNIGGEISVPGDLSITPRKLRSFKNFLPYRKNFHKEIRQTISTLQ